MKEKIGLIIGKFYPLHLGHKRLIDFGKNFTDKLYLILESQENEIIPGDERFSWIEEMYPQNNIIKIHLKNKNYPQRVDEKCDYESFWNLWIKVLTELTSGEKIDYVFTGEDYGKEIAKRMGASFIPVTRLEDGVSGTKCRNDPIENWSQMTVPAQRYFQKKITFMGAESCGKSILSEKIAKALNYDHIHEYAYLYLKDKEEEINYEDFSHIHKGTSSEYLSLIPKSKVIIKDTDLVQTVLWSKFIFDKVEESLEKDALKQKSDLYIVIDHAAFPWIKDLHREEKNRDKRDDFLKKTVDYLEANKLLYVIIKASDFESLEETLISVITSFI